MILLDSEIVTCAADLRERVVGAIEAGGLVLCRGTGVSDQCEFGDLLGTTRQGQQRLCR